MPARRKNFDSAIELYELGASLEDVADACGVSRQAIWKAFSRRAVKMRPRLRSGAANHFFVHGEGYGQNKVAAKIEVMKAIRAGRLVRQSCERCNESPIAKDGRSLVQAHHEDYSLPLHVRWLCVSCHYAEHHQ